MKCDAAIAFEWVDRTGTNTAEIRKEYPAALVQI